LQRSEEIAMKLALISASEVLKVWALDEGETELAIRYTLPDGKQVSPLISGWTDGTYTIVTVSKFEIPDGKETVGPPTYILDNGTVTESYTVQDYRPMVRKSTVQARLIDAGKMGDAYALLTQYPAKFARWFAPDQAKVYCDDPDSVAFLQALGLDPDIYLAPETV
jgi:hypothetical protein